MSPVRFEKYIRKVVFYKYQFRNILSMSYEYKVEINYNANDREYEKGLGWKIKKQLRDSKNISGFLFGKIMKNK